MKHLLYLLAVVFICACNNEKKETSQTINTTQAGLQKTNVVAASNQNVKPVLIFNPPHGQNGHTCALAVGAPLNRSVTQTKEVFNQQAVDQPVINAAKTVSAAGGKLNPKHGEPGHRCDIAVGAPLNSKPLQTVETKSNKTTVIQTPVAKVGKGLNPPHGQPNHRCDIAVGAPLNSKPATFTKPVITPTTAPIPQAGDTLAVKNGIKLNPKHGEPGHRCDIAVGAPLS